MTVLFLQVGGTLLLVSAALVAGGLAAGLAAAGVAALAWGVAVERNG